MTENPGALKKGLMVQGPEHRAAACERAARRTADILVAATALLVLSPVMAIIAVGVRLTSPGPAIFKQLRAGLAREPFYFYKFRTMRVGGDDSPLRELIARDLRGEDISSSGSWKIDGDTRITKFGAILRRASLDELPQLFNVLRGNMALVGPRPMPVWQVEMFPPEFDERFAVRPGITGLWQVSGRSTVGTLEMLRLDIDYVRHRTLLGDLEILARTLPAILRGDGAR
jgi:lipopolysaccharide/colanic/teichoic acid biosynthesis glycosyltransferase